MTTDHRDALTKAIQAQATANAAVAAHAAKLRAERDAALKQPPGGKPS